MDSLLIRGGIPLHGTVRIHGAKNSVLPILAAAAAVGAPCRISNCPRISDVQTAVEILRFLGCQVTMAADTITVDAARLTESQIPPELMRRMRSSVLFLGPLLARSGMCRLTVPGGCVLGERPIDLHLSAIAQMGAEVEEQDGVICCTAKHLHGCTICLPTPSVGATENILLTAMGCNEIVTVCNAAREPEIVDLAQFLCAAGAEISGAGTGILRVRGGALHGCDFAVMPDRIETATYLSAAACAGGHIRAERCCPAHLQPVLEIYAAAGCEIAADGDTLEFSAPPRLQAVSPIKTAPYPAFPTDAQALCMASMAAATGISVFVETVFSSRYRHVPALCRMGADIRVGKQVAVVQGVAHLHGAQIEATDLRGGAGMVAAALGAAGQTQIYHLEHIARGYDSLVETLQSLGAEIRYLND